MSIRRAVPNVESDDLEKSREFYVGLLGFEVAMDMGWIMAFVSPTNPTAQVQVVRPTGPESPNPAITVEVAEVDAVHALARQRGDTIVYPISDEPWGVRRFFVEDPSGVVINVMSHRAPEPDG